MVITNGKPNHSQYNDPKEKKVKTQNMVVNKIHLRS